MAVEALRHVQGFGVRGLPAKNLQVLSPQQREPDC